MIRTVGLGFSLLGVVSSVGCGVGTDPELFNAGGDSTVWQDAAPPLADAKPSSEVPEGIPPIDRLTYDSTAVATFALG